MDTFILSQIARASPTKRTFKNAIKAFGKPVYDFLSSQGTIHEIDLTQPHRHCEVVISLTDASSQLFFENLPVTTEYYYDFLEFVEEYKNIHVSSQPPQNKFMVGWVHLSYSDVVAGYKRQCIFVSTNVPSFLRIIQNLKQSPDYRINNPMFATPFFPNHRKTFITVRLPNSKLLMTKRYYVHSIMRFIPAYTAPLTILGVVDIQRIVNSL